MAFPFSLTPGNMVVDRNPEGDQRISRHGTLLLRESEQGFFSWNFVKAILTQEPSRAGFQGLPEHPRLPGHPGPSRVSQPTQTHPGLPLASQNFQGPPRASQGVRGTTRTCQSFPKNWQQYLTKNYGRTKVGPKIGPNPEHGRTKGWTEKKNMHGPKVGPKKKHARTKDWTEKKHARTKDGPKTNPGRTKGGPIFVSLTLGLF